MNVALYARFSSEHQRETSITDQFRNCEQYALRQGWRGIRPAAYERRVES